MYEPPPVTTVSDRSVVHTSKIELYEESTNEQLKWRFSLTETVIYVTLELEGTGVVATILPSAGDVSVNQAFTSRLNVTWVSGHITLSFFNVSTSDEGVFSCQLRVPGNWWRSKIEVFVLGEVISLNIILLKAYVIHS